MNFLFKIYYFSFAQVFHTRSSQSKEANLLKLLFAHDWGHALQFDLSYDVQYMVMV